MVGPVSERMNWRTPNRLRMWRTEQGFSLDELADLTGLSKSMLSRLERGERGLSAAAKVKIARRLEVPIRELFEVEPVEGTLA
jgi:transcriptional regulator with XRE-family HTH domain